MSTRCLHLPTDFERLPEFRMLCDALARKQRVTPLSAVRHPSADATDTVAISPPLAREQIEAVATHLWMRLWVELAYAAERTNQPGLLNAEAALLFNGSLDGLFGDDVEPVALLAEARVLDPHADNAGEFFCARFEDLNAHLAGDYRNKEEVGAVKSAIVRRQPRLERDAVAQGNLLPLAVFKRRDGSEIDETTRNRCMVMIANVDNALGRERGRRTIEYTEGLIADACAAVESGRDPEQMKNFYCWLAHNREKPLIPKTAEQILTEFDKYFDVAAAARFR